MKRDYWNCSWLIILVVTLLSAAAFGQTTLPASPEARGALSELDKATLAAKADYDKAVAAAKNTATQKLALALDKATKAGNLDEALAIREKLKELQAPPATTTSKPALGEAAPLVGDWAVQSLTGNWHATMRLAADGTASYLDRPEESTLRWHYAKGALEIKGTRATPDVFMVPDPTAREFKGINTALHSGIRMTRLPRTP